MEAGAFPPFMWTKCAQATGLRQYKDVTCAALAEHCAFTWSLWGKKSTWTLYVHPNISSTQTDVYHRENRSQSSPLSPQENIEKVAAWQTHCVHGWTPPLCHHHAWEEIPEKKYLPPGPALRLRDSQVPSLMHTWPWQLLPWAWLPNHSSLASLSTHWIWCIVLFTCRKMFQHLWTTGCKGEK